VQIAPVQLMVIIVLDLRSLPNEKSSATPGLRPEPRKRNWERQPALAPVHG
jgi:hypothetical protein